MNQYLLKLDFLQITKEKNKKMKKEIYFVLLFENSV